MKNKKKLIELLKTYSDIREDLEVLEERYLKMYCYNNDIDLIDCNGGSLSKDLGIFKK